MNRDRYGNVIEDAPEAEIVQFPSADNVPDLPPADRTTSLLAIAAARALLESS